MRRSGSVGTNQRPLRRARYAAKPAATANAARPSGIATRRSRSAWMATNPKVVSGVPVSQLNTRGTIVSGSNRRRRSRRIHDQLLATVVRTTAVPAPARGGLSTDPSASGGGQGGGSIRVIDDVLDRLALRHDRADQVLDHRLVIGVVGVGGQPFLVGEVRHQREIGIPVLDTEIAAESVGLDARDFAG